MIQHQPTDRQRKRPKRNQVSYQLARHATTNEISTNNAHIPCLKGEQSAVKKLPATSHHQPACSWLVIINETTHIQSINIVGGGWKRLHNEELRDLYASPNIVRVKT